MSQINELKKLSKSICYILIMYFASGDSPVGRAWYWSSFKPMCKELIASYYVRKPNMLQKVAQ